MFRGKLYGAGVVICLFVVLVGVLEVLVFFVGYGYVGYLCFCFFYYRLFCKGYMFWYKLVLWGYYLGRL